MNVDLDAGWELHQKSQGATVKRTWCYSEQIVAIDSKFDQRLRISVSVFSRPNWKYLRPKGRLYPKPLSEAEAALAPNLARAELVKLPQKLERWVTQDGSVAKISYIDDPLGGESVVTLTVDGKKLQFRVLLFDSNSFNPRLPWREGSGGKAQLHVQFRDLKVAPPYSWLTDWEDPVSYEAQMLIVVDPPAKKPAPVYRDWNRRFFPGGLPSLNKRRR